MSTTKLSSARRIAIWEAHQRNCIFCSMPIYYESLEIDHIIPERFSENPDELKAVLIGYDLPLDFVLNSLNNLLPCHARCNNRKAGTLFGKSSALFYLEIASSKSKEAFEAERAALKRSRGDRVLASLSIALESGELSSGDVLDILKRIEQGVDAFEAISEIRFSNRIVQGLLKQQDAEALLDEPICPRVHGLDSLEMKKDENGKSSRLVVTTAREWAQARRSGYYAPNTYAIKEEAFFLRAYSFIRAMLAAKVADLSYVRNPKRGVYDLELLPVTLLPILSSDDEEEISKMHHAGTSIQDLVQSGKVIVEERSSHYLSLKYQGMGAAYWEIMRADLNDDGIEDILISHYKYALEGTLGVGAISILQRKSAIAKFELLAGDELLPESEGA
jgi:5-methylcytosine-specific restriction endonuclease McrA